MTHLQQIDYKRSPSEKVAYVSIPMNLNNQHTLRTELEDLCDDNHWTLDWWVANSPYSPIPLLDADAVIFMLPQTRAGSFAPLAFNHPLSLLTRGIRSEIETAVRNKKEIYLAYSDMSGTIGIYNAKVERKLREEGIREEISGVAGTRNTIFQKKAEKTMAVDPIDYHAEMMKEPGGIKKYPADLKDCTPTVEGYTIGEAALGLYQLVKNRGKREGRLILMGEIVSSNRTVPISKKSLSNLRTDTISLFLKNKA